MAQGIFTKRQQLRGLIEKSWVASSAPSQVEYLVVAGGGGGGSGNTGGGGGGGGVLQGIVPIVSGSSITVTVGSGGAGGVGTQINGSSGCNSVFGKIIAIGGGAGASSGCGAGLPGGSGGGGSGNGCGFPGGQGVAGQGNKGGSGRNNYFPRAGGGGGAGTAGFNMIFSASAGTAGNGGAGIASAISGTMTTYAGGGGGGGDSRGSPTSNLTCGGVGGGGNGSLNSNGATGGTNTGGGGGGGGYVAPTFYNGGTGGSGIVIISYPDIYNAPASFGGANSPTSSTSGSGSISFNGSSYTAWSGTTLAGNYTIECWFYQTSKSAQYVPIISGSGGTYNFPIALDYNAGAQSNGYIGAYSVNAVTITSSSAVFTLNTWNHVAAVRSGSTVKIYLNGTQVATGTDTSTVTINTVGGWSGSNSYLFNGYISNVRVTSSAVYTSNFTPSISPLTPITNTQILLGTVSGAYLADSSTNSYTPTITGSPTWNQLSPFATGLGYKNRVYTWRGSGTVTF